MEGFTGRLCAVSPGNPGVNTAVSLAPSSLGRGGSHIAGSTARGGGRGPSAQSDVGPRGTWFSLF